jgi:hypothetical protein
MCEVPLGSWYIIFFLLSFINCFCMCCVCYREIWSSLSVGGQLHRPTKLPLFLHVSCFSLIRLYLYLWVCHHNARFAWVASLIVTLNAILFYSYSSLSVVIVPWVRMKILTIIITMFYTNLLNKCSFDRVFICWVPAFVFLNPRFWVMRH